MSDENVTRTLDDRLGVYSRLLGLRPKKGQVFDAMKLIKAGLPLSATEELAEHMGMESQDFLMRYVGMSDSTVRRHVKNLQRLSADESDRVVRYAHLLSLATNLMAGSEEDAGACGFLHRPMHWAAPRRWRPPLLRLARLAPD